LLAKGNVSFARLLGFLLEGMEHINGLLKLGDIEHAVRIVGLEAQFIGSCSDNRHRLKVTRLVATLDGS
jgi:hypothetical protein